MTGPMCNCLAVGQGEDGLNLSTSIFCCGVECLNGFPLDGCTLDRQGRPLVYQYNTATRQMEQVLFTAESIRELLKERDPKTATPLPADQPYATQRRGAIFATTTSQQACAYPALLEAGFMRIMDFENPNHGTGPRNRIQVWVLPLVDVEWGGPVLRTVKAEGGA